MLYYILRPIGALICKALFRLRLKGSENLPKKGKMIIAANHSSYLDPIVISVSVPRRIKWIVQKPIYHLWWLKWFFVLTKMIPENGAIENSLSLLNKDEILGIFPEGGRSRDGSLRAGKEGVAVLALKTAAPVIPCAIRGAFEAYPPRALFPKPRRIKILMGKPIKFKAVEKPDGQTVSSALDEIMSAIKKLMEERV